MWENLRQSAHNQEADRERRRRLLSFQHEQGGLTDQEYLQRLKSITDEKTINYDEFLEPEPLIPGQLRASFATFIKYGELKQHLSEVLEDPSNKFADELAEEVGLLLIIGLPKQEGHICSIQVKMDIPIYDEDELILDEDSPIEMVFTSTL